MSPRMKKLKPDGQPLLVAIVGGSGSGKTWLAQALRAALGDEAACLSLDDFYRDRSHLSPARRARLNFDHPRAIDWDGVKAVLEGCRRGGAVQIPEYCFTTHSRAGWKEWKPRRIVLMEGLWLLRGPAIRALFDWSLFIECPSAVCLERRLARDCAERGRTPESVKVQFRDLVLPMFKRYVAPQARWATRVLSEPPGRAEVTEIAETLRELEAETRRRPCVG